jgi:hypothetical protein
VIAMARLQIPFVILSEGKNPSGCRFTEALGGQTAGLRPRSFVALLLSLYWRSGAVARVERLVLKALSAGMIKQRVGDNALHLGSAKTPRPAKRSSASSTQCVWRQQSGLLERLRVTGTFCGFSATPLT